MYLTQSNVIRGLSKEEYLEDIVISNSADVSAYIPSCGKRANIATISTTWLSIISGNTISKIKSF